MSKDRAAIPITTYCLAFSAAPDDELIICLSRPMRPLTMPPTSPLRLEVADVGGHEPLACFGEEFGFFHFAFGGIAVGYVEGAAFEVGGVGV